MRSCCYSIQATSKEQGRIDLDPFLEPLDFMMRLQMSYFTLTFIQATACLPSLVDKENVGENLALRLKEPRREAEKVVKDPGKVQLSLREPLRGVVAPPILRR